MPDHEKKLGQLADRYRAATRDLENARDALVEEIRAAMVDGMKQADVLRATDHVWTREMIRRVTRSGQVW